MIKIVNFIWCVFYHKKIIIKKNKVYFTTTIKNNNNKKEQSHLTGWPFRACPSILSRRVQDLAKYFAEISVHYLYHITLINRPNIIREGTSKRKSDNLCDILCDPHYPSSYSSLSSCVGAYKSFFEYCNHPGVTSSTLGCYFWHCLLFQN